MSATEKHAERMMYDLKSLAREGEDLLKAIPSDLSEKSKEARDRLRDALERARQTCQVFQKKALEQAQATDEVIRDYPYYFIGAAVGIGVLIGLLINRK